MNHHSIAIIRKRHEQKSQATEDSKNTAQVEPSFDYLIIDNGKDASFFEITSRAINGGFDYSGLRKAIYEYFELPDTYESVGGVIDHVEFASRPRPFKFNKSQPEATAYLFDLSELQINHIAEKLKGKLHHWIDVRWEAESNIKLLAGRWKREQVFLFSKEDPFTLPDFLPAFRTGITNIVKAREGNKLVVFAGAGVSIDSGVPGWSKLGAGLQRDLGISESDPIKVAETYFQARGPKEYHERVQELLSFGKTKFNALHQVISELNPLHIVTTNYDDHFEQAFKVIGARYSVIRTDSDLPYSKSPSMLIKMHGDFELRNIVLKTYDYSEYNEEFPLTLSTIREIFASKLVLFVGFSFDDPNLQTIIGYVSDILRENVQAPYLFMSIDPNRQSVDKRIQDIESKGVKVLTWDTALNEYYEQVRMHDDDSLLEPLSERGTQVYKFLKVIKEFDLPSDALDNENITEQFVNSLARFKELNALPIELLERITPFRLKRQPKYESSANANFNLFEPLHFETANEEFIELLEKRLDNGRIRYHLGSKKHLTTLEQGLSTAFEMLDRTGVQCIKRKNDTQSPHFRLEAQTSGQECTCVRCLNRRFEIRALFEKVNAFADKSIAHDIIHENSLSHAYGLMKAGQLVKSFYALEDAKRIAIESQQHITFFLACYNQKLLYPALMHAERHVTEREKEVVQQRINTVNMHKLLVELPVDKDVKTCLQMVLEDRPAEYLRWQIHYDFTKLLETRSKFKGTGFYSYGGNHHQRLEANFFLVWNFYHENYLFNDWFPSFAQVTKQYIEGMIASFTTSPRSPNKLKVFSKFFLDIAFEYGYADDLNEIFIKYQLKNLIILEYTAFTKPFESFLESGYARGPLFMDRIFRNELYRTMASSSSAIEDSIIRRMNNFLVIGSRIKLEGETYNKLLEKIIDYLSVSEIFIGNISFKYLIEFIKSDIKSIDQARVKKLIEFCLTAQISPASIIFNVCTALRQNGLKFTLTDLKAAYLLERIAENHDFHVRLENLIPLNIFLTDAEQANFKKLILSSPNRETYPWEILKTGEKWNLWNPIQDYGLYEPFFKKVLNDAPNFPVYKISTKGEISGRDFGPWNNTYTAIKILINQSQYA